MNKIKILYIEDDESQRTSFMQTLQSKGFEVTAAASGKEGLQIVQQNRTEVILCDLNMPEMHGLEVLKQVKLIDREVPVIMLTAHGTINQAVEALQQGAYDFVLKPLEINNLESTIHKAIEKTELQKELRQSESSLHMLMENVPDIIYSLDSKAEFLSVNPAAESLLGYKSTEILKTSVFNYIYSEDRERVRESFQETMRCGDASIKTLEFRMVSKTGEIRDFEVNRKVIFENGEVVRQDGIARDITRRKQFKEELQKYSEELEKLVDERTQKLAYTTRQLAALNAVSNRFTLIYDEDELFEEVPESLTHSLDFDRATLLIEKDGELILRSYCMEKESPEVIEKFLNSIRTKKIKMPPHFRESFEQNKTIFIPDLNEDSRWPGAPGQIIRTKAVVISPIKVHKKPIGVIVGNMQHHEREMDAQDVARFEMFANIVGLALDNIRAYQSLGKKVIERTKSLKNTNRKLQDKAKELEESTYSLAYANVDLLAAQEQLEKKNSEMEQILRELSENSNRLEAILDSSLSVVVMVDKENRVIAANRKIIDYFGLGIDDIINKSIQIFFKKIKNCFEDYEKFDVFVRKLQTNTDVISDESVELDKMFEHSFNLIKPAARIVTVFSVPVLDKDNNELGRVWIYADITKIKRADEQLRAIVDASPLPFIVSRISDGHILYANEQMGELLGITTKELIGKFTPDFYYNPDDRKIVLDKIKRDGFLRNHEVRIRRVDGVGVWMIFSIEITEVGGEPVLIGALYDINKRKQAEEALRESEEIFRQLTENINEIFWIMNFKSKQVLYISPAFEEITGLPRDRVYKNALSLLEAIHPEDKEMVMECMEKQITGEFDVEYRIVRPDGTIRWIRERAFPIRNISGEVYRICGVSEDFTERKLAEEKIATRLRYEEGLAACTRTLLEGRDDQDALDEAMKHLLKAADVGRAHIFENFYDENDELCFRQTHEVCANEVKTESNNSFLQNYPYKKGFSRWRNLLSKGTPVKGIVEKFPQSELKILVSQGILSLVALPVNVESTWFGFIGFNDLKKKRDWGDEDIRLLQTAAEQIGGYIEHKQSEEALQESEERFRNLVENANDIIYSLTLDGKFAYVPPNWTDILGHDVSEVFGKSFELFVHPDDLDACREFLGKVIETGEKQSGVEYRVKHKDGSWRWHTSSASPLKDDKGSVINFIGIAHDVTEKKKFLDDLAEANRHLFETQGKLVQSEKMAALGMLVAGIAHEINTPIGAVHSMHDTLQRAVEKLKQTLETQFPKEYHENRGISIPLKIIDDANKVIENGSERVTNIVKRLRSFARLDEAELKTVDIQEGLEDTLTLVHHEIKHNIKVTKIFNELPPIACFPGRLNQVYLNLLINAKQAIKDKGEITISTSLMDHKVRIEFEDNGIGIPKEKLKKIFDPGFTTKGVGVGTGLGLSICYQILQDHHGEILVESEVGKGTKFTIVFPSNLEEILEMT